MDFQPFALIRSATQRAERPPEVADTRQSAEHPAILARFERRGEIMESLCSRKRRSMSSLVELPAL